jgi:hypothetical protein
MSAYKTDLTLTDLLRGLHLIISTHCRHLEVDTTRKRSRKHSFSSRGRKCISFSSLWSVLFQNHSSTFSTAILTVFLPPSASLPPTFSLVHAHALPDPSPNTPTKPNDNDDGNTGCLQWCHTTFRSPTTDCITPAKNHGGPCFGCGPQWLATLLKLDGHDDTRKMTICKEECVDTASDAVNVRRLVRRLVRRHKYAAGSVAPRGSPVSGACAVPTPQCPAGQSMCSGSCTNMTSDAAHCRSCISAVS